ncbi:MAG: hypothetical protein C5B50_11250 [Verrucomicrobia bacterium]|nr:MAG: hypothetical protein C5B50_11250 [Verrucomicrobiota bacterium]
MKVPFEVPVMTLRDATLFPHELRPLYIFEPRYRQMLREVLEGNRLFSVAMQKPGVAREIPAPVAGLGLIRVAFSHPDGTSHLILQGLARVELQQTVRTKPYRVHRVRRLQTPPCDELKVDALVARMRELLAERMDLELPFPPHLHSGAIGQLNKEKKTAGLSPRDILKFLDSVTDPEQVADLVSCAVLPGGAERQTILETLNVESRLQQLIQFLLAEQVKRKN